MKFISIHPAEIPSLQTHILYALTETGQIWKNLTPDLPDSWIMIFPGFPTPTPQILPEDNLLVDELNLKSPPRHANVE